LRGPFLNFGGVGAEEHGAGGDAVLDDGPVQGEVVAFDAIAPGAVLRWGAEDGEEVLFGVAAAGGVLFELPENVFEAHDAGGLDVALLREAGAEERVGEGALFVAHLFERQALADLRDKVPVEPFVVFKGEDRLAALFGGQGGEKRRGGVGHDAGRLRTVSGGNE